MANKKNKNGDTRMLMLPRFAVVVLLLTVQSLFLLGCSDGEADIADTGTQTGPGDNPDNIAPLIVSTAPLSATEDTLYTYQLDVTDPDDANNGVDLRYTLSQSPAGMTINATGMISWMPENGVTSANVQVLVTDGGENGSTPALQSFVISVTPLNDAPQIISVPSESAITGTPYSYQLVVQDPDDANNGSALTYQLLDAPAGMTVSSTGLIQWMPGVAGVTVDVDVQVSDGGEDGATPDTQSWAINVVASNTAPMITSAAQTAAIEAQLYSYQLTVADAEDANNGADLTFSLINAPVGMVVSSMGLIEWTPPENGSAPWTAAVEVQVADGGEDGVGPDAQSFNIDVTPVNNAPTITSVAPTSGMDGVLYSYQLVVADTDDANNGTDLGFSLLAAPAGMTLSDTGLIEWTPSSVSSADVQVQVTDGGENGAAAATQNWTISIGGVNQAPVITSTPITAAVEDLAYQYQLSVDDADDANNGVDLSFSLITAPVGMTVSTTGLIEWTPTENGSADWTADVEVQVADGGESGASPASQSFTIDVTSLNDAPVFVESSPLDVVMSEDGAPTAFALTLNVTDADNATDEINWSISSAASNGVASATGVGYSKVIGYTPNADFSGSDSFVVQADDGDLSATLTVNVTVNAINDAPMITSVAPTAAMEAVLYQYAVQVSDVDDVNDGSGLSFSLVTAPAGMTVSSTGVIQWTPPNGVTSADVTVEVADGGENGVTSVSQSWTIAVVDVNEAPVITEGASIGVSMSEDSAPTPFALTLNATDADAGAPLTWSLNSAASNGVAAASASGNSVVVNYTPNANYAGSDSFVVQVSDGLLSDTITVNVTVNAVNDQPIITSAALTTATEDSAYQYSVSATDVDGPVANWSLITAPTGMTIGAGGVIDWMPGEGGAAPWSADVVAQISDGVLTDSQSFTINVTPVNDAPTITSAASTSATESALYSYQLVISDSDDSNNGTDIGFSLTTAPAGMTVSSTGLIQWTPPNGVTSADVTVEAADGGENGAAAATQSWTINVGGVNQAPTITSTAVTAATESSLYSYQLAVSDADDANNGTDLSFSLITSPAGMTVSTTGLIAWTPAENGATPWTADVEVHVADGGENGAAPDSQSFTINVTPVNNAPTIDQGDSVAVSMSEDGTPTAFAVTISASDADTAAGSLSWSLGGAASNGTATASGTGAAPTVTYRPNANYVGSDSFIVSVSDGEFTDSITVNVTINAENDAPVISSAAITTATEGALYQYDANVTDSDGPSATWTLATAPAGMGIDAGTGVISWTPGENGTAPWSANVTVQVSDGSLTDSQSFSIDVTPVNDAPLISSSPSTSATEGNLYSYQLVVADPDDSNNGTDIGFSLTTAPAGMTVSATGLIEWTPPNGVSSADVTVEVADGGENGVAAATQSWTITVGTTNDAPTISSVAPTTATEDVLYSYQLVIVDADDANNGTDITFSLTTAPAGMTVSALGLIEWTPPNGVTSADVSVEAADGGEDGAAAATQSWTITVAGANDAPEITEGASIGATMSEDGVPTAFALTLNATDIDGDTLTWSISSAATNGSANVSGTGLSKAISYAPNADFNGSDSFVVSVSDGTVSDTITVNVTVESVNDAPSITSSAITTATEAVLYQYQATSSDVDGPSATWSLTTAPAGMTVSATGLVQWTPQENGATPWTADVVLQISDGTDTDTQSFTINVTPENNAPVITEGASVNVNMSEDSDPTAFALTLNATDSDSSTLTWSISSAASNGTATATGTGLSKAISYTPNADYNGSDSFVVTVSDGALSDTITVNVTIAAQNDAPVISSSAVTTATEDSAYSYDMDVTDSDGPSATFSLTVSPAGMTIDPASGVISWTPGEGGAAIWNENVTVEVTDGTDTDTQSFSIAVTPVNDAPSIDSAAPTSAVEGVLYQYTLSVSDSDDSNNGTDLSFSLTTAPAGMTISSTGVIEWTPPNGVTSADVTARVVDGGENGAAPATQSWTIIVGVTNDAPTITSAAITTATEDAPYSYQLTVNDPDDANNGTDLAFSLTTSPAGMSVSNTGLITWTPGEGGASPWTADVTVEVADGGENGALPDTQSFTINVTPVNDAPEIDQGASVAVNMSEDGTPTAFSVSISAADADTAAGSLTWSLGSAASNGTATATGTGASPTVTYTPNANFAGSDSFVVSVSDGEFSDTITVNVTVAAQNDAPQITSSAITTATEDVLYQYSATSSDIDGPSATWSLTTAPAGMTVSAGGLVQWAPGENGSAAWTADVVLQISDGTLTDTQSFTINVTPVNDAPSITSVAPTTATEDTLYSYQLVISDADDSNNGTDIGFSLTTAPAGMTVSATGLIEWTPANGVTSANVVVEAADGGENGAAAATQSWTINVTAVNDAPSITSVAPTSATEDVLYSYQLVISDADDSNNGTDISFNLTTAPAGMTVSATGLIEWTPANGVTSADVVVEAADGGENGAAAATQSWTITVIAVNDAPVITEGASVGVTMSEDGVPTAFSLTLNATDIEGDTLFWSIQTAAGNGTANATGSGNTKAISYTPTANFNGSDSFVVRVGDGTLFDDITVNVTINAVNDAPVISTSAVTTATEGSPYSYDVDASDAENDTLTFSLTTAPSGMSINPSTGVISWTPGEGGATPWNANVTVQVTDGSTPTAQNYVISVTPVNDAPVITEGASVGVTMSENSAPTPFSLTLNATDVDSATLTWSIVTPASNGAATASGTGASKAISYTPNLDYTGSDSFVVRVSDGSLSDDITVNVTIEQVNTPPSISSTPITEGYEGIPYQYDVDASDAEGAMLTYSLTTSPTGMTINSSTGLIDWLPGDNGGTNDWDADVVVSVTDGSDTVTQSFTVNVEVDRAVHGRVVKGVLANALVEVSLYDSVTDTWSLLASTTTNAVGVWGLDLPTQSVPVRVRVTSTVSSLMTCDAPLGCGAAVFGDTFVPEADIILDSIVPGAQFSGPIAVTPLTTMAAQWIDDMPRGVNDDVIVLANRRVADLFGLDENFAHTRAIDITDASEVAVAAASDMPLVRHALFAASLQQLSASEVMELETVTRGVAQMFSVLGGQMLLQTGAIDLTELGLELDTDTVNYVGFDTIVTSATAVANAVNVGGSLDGLIASLPTLQTRWGDRLLTAMGEGTGYNVADFARALAPLDEFDYYYGLSEAGAAGVDPVNRSIGWLYTDEAARNNTEGMVNALMDVIGGGFKASVCVPALRNSTSCTVESDFNTSISSCSAFSSTCRFSVSGSFAGQTVDVEIPSTPDIRYLLGGTKPFGSYDNSDGISLHFVGTITNATAITTMDIYIDINLSNNDLSTFEGFSALNYANESQLNAALDELIADIFIDARLRGSMSIASTDAAIGTYSISNLDSGFIFNRRTITQGETTPIMTLDVKTMSRTNPAGETLSSLAGTDMFLLQLDDISTLHTASSADNLGVPEIRTIMDGQVSGLQPLIDVLSDYIVSAIDTTTPTPEVDWDAVTEDIADAVISGSGTMDIRDAPQKLYTFGLNADGTIDVSQVNSTDNALTLDLKGVAGYIYANDTLVSTAHLGNADDGLMLSLVNDTQRSYPNANPSATAQLDGLLALIQQLFPPAPEPAP
jgi:VCBS repeat-containing protein